MDVARTMRKRLRRRLEVSSMSCPNRHSVTRVDHAWTTKPMFGPSDLLLRRSFRVCPLPAAAQLRPHITGPSVPVVDRCCSAVLARTWHGRHGGTTGKIPASRPQHRDAGSRRAEQYANARSSCRERGQGYSNLLIRRDLQPHPLPGYTPLTCWNTAQRCAMTSGVERGCKAKMRPVLSANHQRPSRELAVNSWLTVNARC